MASNQAKGKSPEEFELDTEEEEDEEEEGGGWDDWNADEDDNDDSKLKCLFCDMLFSSSNSLFEHCSCTHHFDFGSIRKTLELDFYGSFKFINYVRRMVAENRCWICGLMCNSSEELQNHLHWTDTKQDLKLLWEDDKYLQPFMQADPLLYCFDEDEDAEEDECIESVEPKQLMGDLGDAGNICCDDEIIVDTHLSSFSASNENGLKEQILTSNGLVGVLGLSTDAMVNSADLKEVHELSDKKQRDKNLRVSFAKVAASEIQKSNESYFGSYSSYGIHREMLSDKVRTDAYREAILMNPSVMKGAVVMDVGCGTGILSLFAAQAGASRVIAVEASEKMASVATQIAKDNGLLRSENFKGRDQSTGVVEVVHGMVEELAKSLQIQPHSVDVLLSEWMGYCLLYESMLSSVLFARDKWLKPGGAIVPDTATMFAAGFGRGGTSLPFWENVYGFNMSCVGKELVEDAAEAPIVDVVDSSDIVTKAAVLQTFDLVTMKPKDMDFTTCIELEPNSRSPTEKTTWCYGIVVWFETGFTGRFCKETPTVLSTSPYTQKTHWSQTIFTFKEPVALSTEKPNAAISAKIGTDACPAAKIRIRVSIARAAQHRAIDISVETTGVGHDGRKHSFPVQIFNLR